MTARKKPKPENVWMAWSPDSNYLPQAASVSKEVCWEMVRQFNWSDRVKVVRVRVSPPPRKRASLKTSNRT
mgnify:FL=1